MSNREYIQKRDSGLYIGDTRISLDSIIYAFRRGESPETIQSNWPSLTLEEVYGAITYYLAHRQELDDYVDSEERKYANVIEPLSETAAGLHQKLQRAREEMSSRRH